MLLRRAVLLLALAGRLAWPAAGSPADEEQLWRLLAGGGQVVLVRHAVTTPGVGVSPDTAEMVILTPRGAGSFTVAGTLTAP